MGRGRRTPVDQQITRRLDHQASYGCRGCQDGRDLLALPRQAHDAPEGRKLLRRLGRQRAARPWSWTEPTRAETRQLALDLGFTPVVPPLKTRREPWLYDRQIYKRRNEIERLFRRLKGFRRIFSRFEKLDALFLGFVHFALIYDAVR